MQNGMKFRCASPEHSRVIQEWLFAQGYRWNHTCEPVVSYVHEKFLFAYEDDKMLTHDNNEYIFTNKHFVEQVVTTTTKTILVVESVKPKREKVVVFGKTYYKDDVDAALSKLERATV